MGTDDGMFPGGTLLVEVHEQARAIFGGADIHLFKSIFLGVNVHYLLNTALMLGAPAAMKTNWHVMFQQYSCDGSIADAVGSKHSEKGSLRCQIEYL